MPAGPYHIMLRCQCGLCLLRLPARFFSSSPLARPSCISRTAVIVTAPSAASTVLALAPLSHGGKAQASAEPGMRRKG